MYIFMFMIMYLYTYMYHNWKKVGILATGCCRYRAKKRCKVAKNGVKTPKSTQNQRKNSPNFLVAVVF